MPFALLASSDSPAEQLRCARIFVAARPTTPVIDVSPRVQQLDGRIHLAYLSADFHDHATAHLMAELFETHDTERFEVTAFSFGPNADSPMRRRLTRAFKEFKDVRDRSDAEVAQMLREREIDIAIDLKGLTNGSRPGILALRPAPVQVNYLGYPGTMGADWIDYVVADATVIPPGDDEFYTEKVVRLPDSYQVNDRQRFIAPQTPTRAEAGLPETGIVFCCFNNNYKITPNVFDVWMRLLRRVHGSVLWLLTDNATVVSNLRNESSRRGIAPERLVFASRTKLDDHLARHRIADLFLDTLPCNAHTTASDALWAGLPVVTCMGNTFAGRVGASLLRAIGLPELVAGGLTEYELLAVELAQTPAWLSALRTRLARNRATHPLFDVDRYRGHIEQAYTAMWARHRRGEPPVSFAVEPQP